MRVSTKKFSWDSKTRVFVADISDLGPAFDFQPLAGGKLGLELYNPQTGNVVECVIVGPPKRDASGEDIIFWVLTDVDHKLDFKIILYND